MEYIRWYYKTSYEKSQNPNPTNGTELLSYALRFSSLINGWKEHHVESLSTV